MLPDGASPGVQRWIFAVCLARHHIVIMVDMSTVAVEPHDAVAWVFDSYNGIAVSKIQLCIMWPTQIKLWPRRPGVDVCAASH